MYLKNAFLSRKSAVFRYTGNQSLSVKSISGNQKYYFSVDTRELLVCVEDRAVMRGYSELTELKKNSI